MGLFAKIFFFSLVLLSFTLVITTFSWFRSNSLGEELTAQMILKQFAKARILEKEFVSTREISVVNKHSQIITDIINTIENKNQSRLSNSIANKFREYENQFGNFINITKKRGLNENSGAEGEFRKSVHVIEELVKTADRNDILVQMLMARRAEKDYFLLGTPK